MPSEDSINLKSTDKSSRLDSMVFNLGLSESRAKASDLIKEGKVLVNSKTISKPSYLVKVDDEILIEENSQQWVSRGAIKLLFAGSKLVIFIAKYIEVIVIGPPIYVSKGCFIALKRIDQIIK